MRVPFCDMKKQYHALKTDIDKRVISVLESGAYINGPEVVELEKQLAAFTGAPYALACSSGTDALLLPLMARGIGPGDEVITTAFSFIATAEMICLAGATPVYVDIDPATYNISPEHIERAITSKTKAIMPVSLYGQIYDVEKVNQIAKKHNLVVVEDAAQSFGASQNGKKSCALSEFASTSFYPTKPLGCYGDGGAIFCQSETDYKVMKEIRDHGSESKYYHTRLGLNGRLDTIQCAILLSKLTRFNWEMERRQVIADTYTKAFSSLKKDGFQIPKIIKGNISAWAQYTLEVPDRKDFQKKMEGFGVPTMVHYPRTMPDQPWYKAQLKKAGEWPVSRYAAEHVVSIPFFADMTEDQQKIVIEAVQKSI